MFLVFTLRTITPLLIALAGCLPEPEPAFCGQATWSFTWSRIVNEGFRNDPNACFTLDDDGTDVRIRMPVPPNAHCTFSGVREGTGITLQSGGCTGPVSGTSEPFIMHRWYLKDGTATAVDGDGWEIHANLDAVLLFHDATFTTLDVEPATAVISHVGYPGSGPTFSDTWGVPCVPASRYSTTVTGRLAKVVGSQESCEAVLATFPVTHEITYNLDVANGLIDYGQDKSPFGLLPDRCLVVFDEDSDAWQSRLDLDANTVTIRTFRLGPYIEGSGIGNCDLEWTGTLTPL